MMERSAATSYRVVLQTIGLWLLLASGLGVAAQPAAGRTDPASLIQNDWMRQAAARNETAPLSAEDDAAGGCDGIKDGSAGFHTQKQQDPWWQVDLGSVMPLGRIVIWNRVNDPIATPRAKRLVVGLSTDGKSWEEMYRHDGRPFRGIKGGPPLAIPASGKSARFVRVGLADKEYFHLDEVEVFGTAAPKTNLALDRPATQSSTSSWSTPRRNPASGRSTVNFRRAAREALALAVATRVLMAENGRIAAFDAALAGLQEKFDRAGPDTDLRELFFAVRSLRRELILSHPALDFDRLLVNKRPPPKANPHQCEQYLGRHSAAGPGLVILDSWKNSPKETVLLEGKLPTGSVLHPDLSFDAKRIIFSFCDHTVVTDDSVKLPVHPTEIQYGYDNQKYGGRRFFIYEATLDGRTVRQLTGTPSDPMKTAYDRATVLIEDLDPCYLPGGGFVFASTRSQNFGRCHGGVYKPAFLLYRANADGSGIRQISFAEANEWDPSVLPDGRIIYTRWDYINRHNTWFQSLWVTRPDGAATAHYYGNYTKNPCVISEARSIPGSRRAVATAAAHHFFSAGSIILVDPDKGQDGAGPLTRITPEVKFPESEGWDLNGCYATPYPLSEDMFLVAYSPELVRWQGGFYSGSRPSDAAFGIYLIDVFGGRELVYRDPDVSCFTPIPIRPRPVPPTIPSALPPPGNAPATGTCYIQDIYRSAHPIPKGSIKSLRINRIHDQPTASFTRRSRATEEVVKSVIGIVPVNQDGSAGFSVPANVGFQLQALDENGMAVMTMRSLMYLQPGETVSCVGCHEPRAAAPHASAAKPSMAIHAPRPVAGPAYEGGFSFGRTVQPVLDRHCIGCHGLKKKPDAGLDLLAGRAYDALTKRKGLVAVALSNRETFTSKPKDYFAHAGRLAKALIKGHKGHESLRLRPHDLERIITWLDLNAQQYGDYSFNRVEDRKPFPEGEKALREHIAERFGKELSREPFEALVNVGQPSESRILMAPLSAKAGGWGQVREGGWTTKRDVACQKMTDLVEASIAPLEYNDIKGTCGRDKCVCGSCWVRKLRETKEVLVTH